MKYKAIHLSHIFEIYSSHIFDFRLLPEISWKSVSYMFQRSIDLARQTRNILILIQNYYHSFNHWISDTCNPHAWIQHYSWLHQVNDENIRETGKGHGICLKWTKSFWNVDHLMGKNGESEQINLENGLYNERKIMTMPENHGKTYKYIFKIYIQHELISMQNNIIAMICCKGIERSATNRICLFRSFTDEWNVVRRHFPHLITLCGLTRLWWCFGLICNLWHLYSVIATAEPHYFLPFFSTRPNYSKHVELFILQVSYECSHRRKKTYECTFYSCHLNFVVRHMTDDTNTN